VTHRWGRAEEDQCLLDRLRGVPADLVEYGRRHETVLALRPAYRPLLPVQCSLAAALCLLLGQRPDAIPLGAWGGGAELRDAFEE
jgi:hypothetical protein